MPMMRQSRCCQCRVIGEKAERGYKAQKAERALLIKHCCPFGVRRCIRCLGVGSGTVGGNVEWDSLLSLLLIAIMPKGVKGANRPKRHRTITH